MPVLGLAAWAGGLAALLLPTAGLLAAFGAVALGGWLLSRRIGGAAVLAWLLLAVAVAVCALLRGEVLAASPVTEAADRQAVATLEARVTMDPRLRDGRHGPYVVLRAQVTTLTARGASHRLGAPVLVVAEPEWRQVPIGSLIRFTGRLDAADGPDLAAIVRARSAPEVLERPAWHWRVSTRIRESLRRSVAHTGPGPSTLVPSLVVGDDEGMPEELADDFRATGLTHLLAVSGTNLTIVVGSMLIVARWSGVRGRGFYIVGAVGIVGFVVLCRGEPSALRAATMGAVALIAMGRNGRERGTRALGAAMVGLLLVEPWLATNLAFVLSVLATGGILFLAPVWRDAMMRWLPRWLAETIAVPAAAQITVTPVIAGISGQVSLVAVAANLIAGPAVAPATVLGLVAGLLGVFWPTGAALLGSLAGWSGGWIIGIAHRGAALPMAAVEWQVGAVAMLLLTALCVLIALATPHLLGRRDTGLAVMALTCVLVAVPLPTVLPSAWPPAGWTVVACDVGQGDGYVLRVGERAAVVIDAGPEPGPVDRCLRRLGINQVPVLMLTHFHADHVRGLAGVLRGREVGEIWVTGYAEPAENAGWVAETAAAHDVAVRVPDYGESARIGAATLQVVAPRSGVVRTAGGAESGPNNASLVLYAERDGVRMLFTGDIEPAGQGDLAAAIPTLDIDLLTVPHHGSARQDVDFLLSLGAGIALVSAGENNYGHPDPGVLAALVAAGVEVYVTRDAGSVAVAPGEQGLRVVGDG